MLAIGALVWISLRPLLQLGICTACGFILSKVGLFPLVVTRGVSQIILNITLPALLFSVITPAFTSQNIRALGPLTFMAVFYHAVGMLGAFILGRIFWVPHRFRYGLLAAGCWGNIADIPIAILLSITASAPFNPGTDTTISVAYISAFSLVFMVSLFPLGGQRLVAKDFEGPEVALEEVKRSAQLRRRSVLRLLRVQRSARSRTLESWMNGSKLNSRSTVEKGESRAFGFNGSASAEDARHETGRQTVQLGAETESTDVGPSSTPSENDAQISVTIGCLPAHPTHKFHKLSLLGSRLRHLASTFFNPPTIAIFIALPISLIPPLKALFVPGVPGTDIPNAPDGQPPLSFILDAAVFIGDANVPMALLCLGSALSRLKIPKHDRLPKGAIISLAVLRMIVLPILGVAVSRGLTRVGFIDPEDKVLQFVCMVTSGVPTATTQVFLTIIHSGTGETEHLAPFLIPQYAMMFVTMTILIAYGIHILF